MHHICTHTQTRSKYLPNSSIHKERRRVYAKGRSIALRGIRSTEATALLLRRNAALALFTGAQTDGTKRTLPEQAGYAGQTFVAFLVEALR